MVEIHYTLNFSNYEKVGGSTLVIYWGLLSSTTKTCVDQILKPALQQRKINL
jgi:hypothetical protein